MKVTRIIYTPTGEQRPPRKGEWCLDQREPTIFWFAAGSGTHSESIYRRTEEEIEIDGPVPEWCRDASMEWHVDMTTTNLADTIHRAYLAAKERGEA